MYLKYGNKKGPSKLADGCNFVCGHMGSVKSIVIMNNLETLAWGVVCPNDTTEYTNT